MRVCILFSGGKDSTFALHWAFLKGFDVKCLVTIKPRREDSWMFHFPNIEITKFQAEAIGLPQIYVESSGVKEKELDDLKFALKKAIEEFDIQGVVTGVLLSDYQRMRIAIVCEELGLKTYSPLWRKNQEWYLKDLIEFGFKIVITAIDCFGLPPKYLGKVLTVDDVIEIIKLAKTYGFNPAFEGGEAETLVIDAPLFKKRIEITKYRIIRLGEYSWRMIIEDVKLCDKTNLISQ